MAKLQKLVTVTTYRWEEADLTEEQLALYKGDEDAFMENYHEGEYDLDFDLTRDKEYQEEYIFDNKEVNTSLPGDELSDVDSLKYFFQKYLFSVENGKPSQNGARVLKLWIDLIQQKNTIQRYY